jgi:hypothetical protein
MRRLTMQGYGYILTMTAFAFLMMPVHARAADDQVITLTCDGSVTAGTGRAEQVSKMGMVINLAEQTVAFGGHVVGISRVDASNVSFSGQSLSSWEGIRTTISIDGSVDRVTGTLHATQLSIDHSLWFDLGCKPTNRLF